ncbi:MAG: ABC-F family ATP-binding cassette domain-containing protein [Pseudomonadales bacterium]|nr:ABC-F family ATP-binding cassette domain-containing protein [Pseudomonadales bacterium]
MALIQLHAVSFHYEQPFRQIFTNLDLVIDTQWRTGLTGNNGSGKSTLLALIRGDRTPQSGQIVRPPVSNLYPATPTSGTTLEVIREAIAPYRYWEDEMDRLLRQGDEASLTAYNDLLDLYIRHKGYEVDGIIQREASAIGLEAILLRRPFASLSGGEQTRALMIALFTNDNDYALIDEPTNHLDSAGRQKLADYLQSKQGYLLVSHDRDFLARATDHMVAFNAEGAEVIHGNFDAWYQQRQLRLFAEEKEREKITREVSQLQQAARARRDHANDREKDKYGTGLKDKGYIGHMAARQMKRARTIEHRIEGRIRDKEALLTHRDKQRPLKIHTASSARSELAILQNITFGYDQQVLLQDFSLHIQPGDRIAISGPNGSGKSTLLNLLARRVRPWAGSVVMPGHIRIAEAFQQPLWRDGFLRDHLQNAGIDEVQFRQYMGVLNIDRDIFDTPMSAFSRGELRKTDLIRSLMTPSDLLIWDEPLNYLDLTTRERIESSILEYQPTIIFIEHDAAFVRNIATRVLDSRDFIA